MAALHRAVALAQVDRVAVRVGEDLDLDVAGIRQVALQVHHRVGEELLRLAARALERVLERAGVQRDAKALAATARRGLDRDRVSDLLRDRPGLGQGRNLLAHPRNDRHARLVHQRPRADLGPHRVDRLGRGADEHDAGLGARAGERRVLGEEAVAGVDRLGARARSAVSRIVSTLR